MLIVFFDESCGICMKTKSFLEKLNIKDCEFSTVSKMKFDKDLTVMKDRFIDLQSYDGVNFYSGYDTYVQIFKRYYYPFHFIYFLLKFWPIKYIGKKIYKKISRSRSCSVN